VADGEIQGAAEPPGRRDADMDFDTFFDVVWPRTRVLAARMGLGREEAEDVGLAALAVTYDRWGRVSDLPYREAWTLRVTANLALRALKKRRMVAVPPVGWAGSPEEEVTSRLALRSMLGGLPRRQRQVVVLRYLADLPESEVAEVLGIDVGSVKQHASRGRVALRDALARPGQGGDDVR
jgi:RNA polymerase sigma factor (sigma-70 family)